MCVFSFVAKTLGAYKFWPTSNTLKCCSEQVELNNLYSEKRKRSLKGSIF